VSYNKLDLKGKSAVVIGGTSGIGLALALGLAEAGADVIASSRRADQVDAAAEQIQAWGRKTAQITSDVCDRSSIQRLLDESIKAFGKVDILINCAGRTKKGPTLDYSEDDWNVIMETNLTGTLRGCQIFGKHMLERGYGRIINIASITTFLGLHEVAAYGASKAAVGSLTKTLAIEWSRHGVMVNAIAPGFFVTPLNQSILLGTPRGAELLMRSPMGRFGKTEELVGAAVYLASDAASFVSGQIITVDGGFLASGVNQ
jgi:NAD(P)-dependent dehydrogenase (short-subunit alcohol dehydrogenase family)